MQALSNIDPNVLGAVAVVAGALITVLGTIAAALLGRDRHTGSPTQIATGNSGPVNQSMTHHAQTVVFEHSPSPKQAPPVPAPANTSEQGDDETWIFVLAAFAVLVAIVLWWDTIAAVVISLVALSRLITAGTWFSRRGLGTTSRWLSALTFIVSAAVVWAVIVFPNGFSTVPSLEPIAQTLRAEGVLEIVSVLMGNTGVLLYLFRFFGLGILLFLLAITTAEVWGLAILSRVAIEVTDHPTGDAGPNPVPGASTREARRAAREQKRHERRLRLGTWLAARFPLTPGRMLWFTAMLAIAVALVHPATLGWFHDLTQSQTDVP